MVQSPARIAKNTLEKELALEIALQEVIAILVEAGLLGLIDNRN